MPPVGPHPLPVVNTFPPKGPELGPASAGGRPGCRPGEGGQRDQDAAEGGDGARARGAIGDAREHAGGPRRTERRNGPFTCNTAIASAAEGRGSSLESGSLPDVTRPGGGQLAATAVAN